MTAPVSGAKSHPAICHKIILACLAVMLVWGMGATRAVGASKTDGERSSQDLARVVTATYLGSEGNEWLSAAAFPGDDSIMIGGVSLDAEITLRGVQAKVLGEDVPQVKLESIKEFVRLGEKNPGLPAMLKWSEATGAGGKTEYAKFHWLQPEATGFIGRFSPDLKKVLTLRRFPHGAGSVTSVAVDKTGAVYLSGAATDRIAGLFAGRRTETIPTTDGVTEETWGCRQTYLVKLSADLAKVEWLVEIKGWSYAPKLRVLNDGNISLLGPGLRVYAPDGRLVRSIVLPNKWVVSGSAVDPVTGRYTRVGDQNISTGREPYRNPRLNIYNPDGSLHMNLYAWASSFVVLDSLRLVADSAVRRSAYDAEGNLVISSWSHGGNNVMFSYPYDIHRRTPNGLGYNQSQSVACVVKMGPDFNVLAATAWTSSAFIHTLACAADGSVAWAGMCNRILRLANAISDQTEGPCVVVMEPSLSAYRFISATPACGSHVLIGGSFDRPDVWGFASGICQGRPMLIGLTGVVRSEKQAKGPDLAAPLKNPPQAEFGGGLMDGYALLLDLSKTSSANTNAPAVPSEPVRLSVNRYAKSKNPAPRKHNIVPDVPSEGEVFNFRPTYPRWTTVDAEFRDANGKYWPSFCFGNPVSGQITWNGGQPQGTFEVACPKWCQTEGDQNQRVLGPLMTPQKDALPKVSFRVTALGPMQTKDVSVDINGKTETRELTSSEATGELEVAGKVIKIHPQCVIRVGKVVESAIRKTQIDAFFTVKGQDLGLTGERANADIDVHVSAQAHAGDAPPPRPRKS